MRVRLAFSVAAHLEPEVLLIDEVLAVGDIDFQKKCLKICEIGAEMRLLYTTALFNDYVKNDLSLEELETAA